MNPTAQPARVPADRFAIQGTLQDAIPIGSGHIHATYRVAFMEPGGHVRRYTFQQIHRGVFRDPAALTENIRRVTEHLHAKQNAAGDSDVARRVLTMIPTRAGDWIAETDTGEAWRAYEYIDDSHTVDVVADPTHAREAARAFGLFQRDLADLPAPRLTETIPRFHDTPARIETLVRAVEADTHNRAATVKADIEFALQRRDRADVLLRAFRDGRIPERVTHNDAKINNVLFNDDTGEALCVIDLDTVMPGLAPYDFGDLVRTVATSAAEDEPDTAKVQVREPYFRALMEGYLSAARASLNKEEIALLAVAGQIITLETGVRFLTDYLNGDTYFKTQRPGHNLDRARNQFALVTDMERKEDRLQAIVDGL